MRGVAPSICAKRDIWYGADNWCGSVRQRDEMMSVSGRLRGQLAEHGEKTGLLFAVAGVTSGRERLFVDVLTEVLSSVVKDFQINRT